MAETAPQTEGPSWIARYPMMRVVAYYLLLALAILILREFVPGLYAVLSKGELPRGVDLGEAIKGIKKGTEAIVEPYPPGIMALIGMVASFVLMLPVVWLYAFTRQKRGYQQSMVQTLVILPLVVSSVIILVQSSVALAFSLGGVVGAVSFRNRLDDTKDAIYVFVSIAVGLASGVQVLEIALALTLFFNVIIVVLWYTDFGRVPAQMQASVVQKRIEKAKGMVGAEAKKTSELVNAIDQQILMSMTPDQLEHLAAQALKRQKKLSSELYDTDKDVEKEDKEAKYDILRIVVKEGASADNVRDQVEKVLAQDAKDWSFEQAGMGDGKTTLDYKVRSKKSVPKPILVETVRRSVITQVDQVTFV